MELRDIMTKQVEIISPDATLQEAAEKMRILDAGSLPVCSGTEVIGMITDRDIVIRAIAKALHPTQTRVSEVMSDNVVFAYEDQDVEEAAMLMENKQVRRLIVVNQNKDLVGIVSLADVTRETGDETLAGEVLQGVVEPHKGSSPQVQL